MSNGIRTTNLERQFAIDELIGNVTADGVEKTARIPMQSVAQQLVVSGPFTLGDGFWAETYAILAANPPADENTPGYVLDDPDPTKNGVYLPSGATWVWKRGFPDAITVLTNVGGTASAITAESKPGIDPAQVVAYILPVAQTNPGSVTLVVDGGDALPLIDPGGAALAPGALVAGRITMVVPNGDEYRLLLPALAVATFDHMGTYAALTAYSEGQVVTGSDGNWYQLKIPTSQGEDPVGSVTGNWLRILTGAAVADDSVDEPKAASTFTNMLPQVVADRTALKAIDTARYKVASLIEAGRSGTFDQVSYATYSALVTADTAEAIIVRSTDDDTKAWLRRDHYGLNIMWAGASQSASEATNRTALEATIAVVDALGYGSITIPPGVNYGYDRNDLSTHPNHIAKAAGVSIDFATFDMGVGSTYTAPSKDGVQIRVFFYTVQTSPTPGLHDSNMLMLDAEWHPNLFINNTADLAAVGDPSRTAGDNRRGSVIFANDSVATWLIGQGGASSASLDDEQLSQFQIVANGFSELGSAVLTGVMTINKKNAQLDWYTTNQLTHFRDNALTKLVSWETLEATEVRAQWKNSSNEGRLSIGTGTTDTDNAVAVVVNGSNRLRILRNGNIYPGSDNAQSLGNTGARFTTIYATTGTINTSDLLLKTNITSDIQDAVFRAVRRVGIVQFQWKDAVEVKGGDGARIHFGVIAQQVAEAFEAEGLDPRRFGLFCHDEWEDQYDEVREHAKDADGNLLWEEWEEDVEVHRRVERDGKKLIEISVEKQTLRKPIAEVSKVLVMPAGSRFGIRYEELLALMLAAERKRVDDLEARVATWELRVVDDELSKFRIAGINERARPRQTE